MVTDINPVLLKAAISIVVRPGGSVMVVNLEHAPKQSHPIVVRLLSDEITTDVNSEHSLKALLPIVVTLSGIDTDTNDEHEKNAPLPIVVRVLVPRNTTDVNDVHP